MFLAAGICGNMINHGAISIRHSTTASTQHQTVASENPSTSPTTSRYVPQAKKRSAAHNLMTAGMAKVLSVAGSSLFPMMASSWVICVGRKRYFRLTCSGLKVASGSVRSRNSRGRRCRRRWRRRHNVRHFRENVLLIPVGSALKPPLEVVQRWSHWDQRFGSNMALIRFDKTKNEIKHRMILGGSVNTLW